MAFIAGSSTSLPFSTFKNLGTLSPSPWIRTTSSKIENSTYLARGTFFFYYRSEER